MNLTISGHHLDVSPSLREYVLTKLDRVTRHFDQVKSVAMASDPGVRFETGPSQFRPISRTLAGL